MDWVKPSRGDEYNSCSDSLQAVGLRENFLDMLQFKCMPRLLVARCCPVCFDVLGMYEDILAIKN